MQKGQFGWFALQGAIVVGVVVFFVEVINTETPDKAVQPHVALIIGVGLALLVTVALSGLFRLSRRLLSRGAHRQGRIR